MSTTGTQQPGRDVGDTAQQDGSELLLRVSHLAKAFGATQAVRDCSFELRAGEVHALGRRERLRQERRSSRSSAACTSPMRGRSSSAASRWRRCGRPAQAQRPRNRHRLPGGPRRRVVLGARQRLARQPTTTWRTARPAAREARPGARRRSTELLGRDRSTSASPSRSCRCPIARPAASCARCCGSRGS